MYSMFNECNALEKLDLSSFNTKRVIHFDHMFNQCISLKILIFPNLYISYSAEKDYMFNGCEKLLEEEKWKTKINNIYSSCICY